MWVPIAGFILFALLVFLVSSRDKEHTAELQKTRLACRNDIAFAKKEMQNQVDECKTMIANAKLAAQKDHTENLERIHIVHDHVKQIGERPWPMQKEFEIMQVRQRTLETKIAQTTRTVNVNINEPLKGKGKSSLLKRAGVTQ